MQKDFHYYCIAVLARAAGFSEEDALTIAYASQYTDDATEDHPLPLANNNPQELCFDPIRTSYKLPHEIIFTVIPRNVSWSRVKGVHLPFHFLPPKPFIAPGFGFFYVTKPGDESPFAQGVLKEGFSSHKEYSRNKGLWPQKRILALCRMGIALHTFADTWAHQGFSGRKHKENDVHDIFCVDSDGIRKESKGRSFFSDFPALLGHGEALTLPDEPFRVWDYIGNVWTEERRTYRLKEKKIPRNNREIFLAAAKAVFKELQEANDRGRSGKKAFKEIEDEVRGLFSYWEESLDKRCQKWKQTFGYLFKNEKVFSYDQYEWSKAAIETERKEDIEWGDYSESQMKNIRINLKPDFFESPFYNFHVAALMQQNYVLSHLIV
jgi:hypothetical protein